MGPSGGGKSTVVNLVERFYDPTKGEVLLDSVPLPDIDHEHLHSQASFLQAYDILSTLKTQANGFSRLY